MEYRFKIYRHEELDGVIDRIVDLLDGSLASSAETTRAGTIAGILGLGAEDRIHVVVCAGEVVVAYATAAPMSGLKVWKLDHMAILPEHRDGGIGGELLTLVEERIRRRGGLTLLTGVDDDGPEPSTNLWGHDRYPEVSRHLQSLAPPRHFALGFYLRAGYTVVGVLPHAKGRGRHEILLSKRLAPESDGVT